MSEIYSRFKEMKMFSNEYIGANYSKMYSMGGIISSLLTSHFITLLYTVRYNTNYDIWVDL